MKPSYMLRYDAVQAGPYFQCMVPTCSMPQRPGERSQGQGSPWWLVAGGWWPVAGDQGVTRPRQMSRMGTSSSSACSQFVSATCNL